VRNKNNTRPMRVFDAPSDLTADAASAILQLDCTTKGFLPPRLTATQRNAIVGPVAGLLVYNSTNGSIDCYNGGSWASLTTSTNGSTGAFNVLDFGALGDGVTDDRTAINNAITAVNAAGGGVLLFPAGKVFTHANTITISANVTIMGYGAELKATDNPTASTGNQQVICSGDNISIYGLKLSSVNDGVTKGSPHKLQSVGTSTIKNLLLKNIEITSALDMGVLISNVNGFRMAGCYIHDCNADGIHLTNGTTNFSITGCVVSNTGDDNIAVVSNQANGVYCTRGVISNNVCTGNRTTAGRNIAVAGGKDIVISNNMCADSNNAAIMVMADTNGTTFGCEDISVIGNEVINSNKQSTASHADIYVIGLSGFPCNRTVIRHNKVRNNTFGDGIKLGSFTNQSEISFNDVYATTSGNGIFVTGSATDVRVIGNRIQNAAQDGINTGASVVGYLIIQDNMIDGANTPTAARATASASTPPPVSPA
jgi:hypothetical protein